MDTRVYADLADMPNIGREVARLLVLVGINTPDELIRAGAVEAATRIRKIRPEDPPCRSMLAGLHGAILGVRWHSIPKPQREKIWLDYCAHSENS